MTSELFRWLILVSVLSPIIPLLCLFIYKKGQPRQNLILSASCLISLVFDAYSWVIAYILQPVPSGNLYIVVAFPAIMAFYQEILIKRSGKILVRIFTAVFLVVAIIVLAEQGLYKANTITWILSSTLITITSLFFVADLRLMDDSAFVNNRFHKTNIIINSSLAIYYFSTIILFTLTDYVFAHFTIEDVHVFWLLHDALNVLKHLGITVAFYLSGKKALEFAQRANPME